MVQAMVVGLRRPKGPEELFSRLEPGATGQTTPFALMRYLALDGPHGAVVRAEFADQAIRMRVEGGKLVDAIDTAGDGAAALAQMLAARYDIDLAEVEASLARARASGEPLAEVLAASQLIDASARTTVHERTLRYFLRLFLRSSGGRARVEPLSADTGVSPRGIPLFAALAEYARDRLRELTAAELEPHLAALRDGAPQVQGDIDELGAMLHLGTRERFMVEEVFNGQFPLDEVYRRSLFGRTNTMRLLALLVIFGRVEVTEPVFRSRTSALAGLERARRLLDRIRRGNLFERVGSHYANHPDEHRQRFHQIRNAYGPGSRAWEAGGQLGELAREIWKLSSEAWEVIKNPQRRREYRNQLLDENQRRAAVQLLYKQAKMAEFRGEIRKARILLETALDITEFPEARTALATLGQGAAPRRTL